MTPQEFIYFLQGFLEISNPETINAEQTALIKQKLESCFYKGTKATTLNSNYIGSVPTDKNGSAIFPYLSNHFFDLNLNFT